MPHSLRAKLKYLTICGHIRKKDYERLCKALDNEGVLDKIRAEIIERQSLYKLNEVLINRSGATVDYVFNWVLEIIDKYKDKGVEE